MDTDNIKIKFQVVAVVYKGNGDLDVLFKVPDDGEDTLVHKNLLVEGHDKCRVVLNKTGDTLEYFEMEGKIFNGRGSLEYLTPTKLKITQDRLRV